MADEQPVQATTDGPPQRTAAEWTVARVEAACAAYHDWRWDAAPETERDLAAEIADFERRGRGEDAPTWCRVLERDRMRRAIEAADDV